MTAAEPTGSDIQKVQITFEGCVYSYPEDFGEGIYFAKPVILLMEDMTVDSAVEDLCIDVSLGETLVDDDNIERRVFLNAFYKVRKKNTEFRRYFKRVVEVTITPDGVPVDEVYRVLEEVG